MEGKSSSVGLYIAIIALLVGVANIFLGVLPTVEMKGKVESMESRLAKAEKPADNMPQKAMEWAKKRALVPAPMPAPAPAPAPTPPLPVK